MDGKNQVPQVTFGRKIAPKYRERVGSYIIPFDAAGRVALIKTPRYLLLLGGEMERGESDEDTIKRESLEECGMGVKVGELVAIGHKYAFLAHLNAHVHFVARCHLGEITGKLAPPLEKDHTLVYMNVEEAMHRMFFDHQRWALGIAVDVLEKRKLLK